MENRKNDELLPLRTAWKFLDALASTPPRQFLKSPNFSTPSRTLGLTLLLLTALAGALALPNAHAQSHYTVTDLGDASQVTATCLNNRSDVAGQYHQTLHAWLYRHGQSRDLGVLSGGTSSSAAAINDLGQVVGSSSGNYFTHAFVYDGAQMRDLGTLPGGTSSFATGINAWGQVAGYSDTATPNRAILTHAFLYSNGRMLDLGTLPGATDSQAFGINDQGQVIGRSNNHAFIYSGGRMRDLGMLPGGMYSFASSINAWGQVVGSAAISNSPYSDAHAFLYSDGRMRDLGTLPGDGYSFATGINDQGQVIGLSRQSPDAGLNRAFLYHCGKMRDLTALLPSGSGWVLAGATAINNLGQILVFGTDGNGHDAHNLLLTPTRD